MIVNLKIDRLPPVHIVDRYLDTVAELGVKNDGQGLDYFIPPADEVAPASIIGEAPSFIALAIGAAHATKRIPLEKVIEICRGTSEPIILLGGPAEAEDGAAIAAQSGSHVFNACGNLRLHQSASLIRQARLVITPDTGMMHIAAAFHKKIISVWGNTIPEFGMYPYYPEGMNRNATFEVQGLSCRPCSKIGHPKCPRGHFKCMRQLNVADLLDNVKNRNSNTI